MADGPQSGAGAPGTPAPETPAAGVEPHEIVAGDPPRRLAARHLPGAGPAVAWCGGLRSDMDSAKALAIEAWARGAGRANLRFDYSGHGRSSGAFEDGTIGAWCEDAAAALGWLDARGGDEGGGVSGGPPVVVGSSMGAWIALLLARRRLAQGRPLAGLVLVAPAVDFTEALMWARFPEAVRREVLERGAWHRPSAYGPPIPVTRALVEEGRRHLLLGAPFRVGCPVRVLQGMRDPDVPWEHAARLMEHLAEDDASIAYVPDGDHRLSRDEDVALLLAVVAGIA